MGTKSDPEIDGEAGLGGSEPTAIAASGFKSAVCSLLATASQPPCLLILSANLFIYNRLPHLQQPPLQHSAVKFLCITVCPPESFQGSAGLSVPHLSPTGLQAQATVTGLSLRPFRRSKLNSSHLQDRQAL